MLAATTALGLHAEDQTSNGLHDVVVAARWGGDAGLGQDGAIVIKYDPFDFGATEVDAGLHGAKPSRSLR